MSEKTLRLIFIAGTALFLLLLVGMTVNTMTQVNNGRTQVVTEQVAAGKKIWQQKNCNDCHTILGIGGYYAPDLTKTIVNRGDAWLVSWLTNPMAVNPKAEMPNQSLSANEVKDVVAFLAWVGAIDTNNWPPKPIVNVAGLSGTTSPAQEGALLFQQKSCIGCHVVNGQGATGPGPDLSHIAAQPYDALGNSASDLTAWLQDPGAVKPATTMPKLPLTGAEVDAIVQYLLTLK